MRLGVAEASSRRRFLLNNRQLDFVMVVANLDCIFAASEFNAEFAFYFFFWNMDPKQTMSLFLF